MKKVRRFAMGTTSGPDITNLQLNFWRRTLKAFFELRGKWDRYAVTDDQPDPIYTEDEFVVDAAEVIVLAGTSVSELAGQNGPPPKNGRTPDIKKECLPKWFGTPLPVEILEFIDMYDALRHFGQAKYDAVSSLDPQAVSRLLTTAQCMWVTILKAEGMPHTKADLVRMMCWMDEWKAGEAEYPPVIHFEHDFGFH